MQRTPDIPDLEGQFIAANHLRTGRDVASRIFGSSRLGSGDHIRVRRTGVVVEREAGAFNVRVGDQSYTVTKSSGADDALDMLAHSRPEIVRALKRVARMPAHAPTTIVL